MSKSTDRGRELVHKRLGGASRVVADIEGSEAYAAVTRDTLYIAWASWGNQQLHDIPLDTISTINVTRGPLGGLLMVVEIAGQSPFKTDVFSALIGGSMPNLSPRVRFSSNRRKEIAGFVTRVMKLRAALRTPRLQQVTLSIPEQIKQLAELRDQGILSQEEFQTKKADLLSRM